MKHFNWRFKIRIYLTLSTKIEFQIIGKHEEKRDDHGYIARHFVRKYLIPEECDPEKTTSSLSTDGVLTISTPLKPEAITAKEEKPIKIEHTGKPAIEKKEEPEEKQRLTSSQST